MKIFGKKRVVSENKAKNSFDAIFAKLRKCEARIRAIETDVSTIRRDLRRHDKMMYEKPIAPLVSQEIPVKPVSKEQRETEELARIINQFGGR